jgi:hypothetical protein
MLQQDSQGFTDIAMNRQAGAGDVGLAVKFYLAPLQNQKKSKEEGRPIFEDKEFIKIMIPGSKSNVIDRVVRQTDFDRFPEHYRRFKARTEQNLVEGTRLEEWPGITRGQCEELKFFNVFTVEQLATLAASSAGNIMGIQTLKTKASAYLDSSKDNATAEKFAALEAKYEALLARVDGAVPDDNDEPPAPKRKRRNRAEMNAARLNENME